MHRNMDYRNRSVDPSHFAMVPRADVPRSLFNVEHTYKSTFDAGYLVPIYVDEVLPGDSHRVDLTAFARMATPIFPVMDNLHLDTFFFFVPCRLVWDNWQRFMGERDPDPTSSISYLVPRVNSAIVTTGSLYDYFGLPVHGNPQDVNSLPFRAYNLIYNEWFRDQNLQSSISVPHGDGPDNAAIYTLRRRGKRHDYFTSCLPWPQKIAAVSIPLSGDAVVRTSVADQATGVQQPMRFLTSPGGMPPENLLGTRVGTGQLVQFDPSVGTEVGDALYPSNLYADLSTATATTINALRQSFQIQKLLERDARGGTRYTELLRAHFGVTSPDARLQRPEYLGGASVSMNISPVAKTSSTDATSPQGSLAGVGTSVARSGFSKAFTEHGYIIGIANVRADLTYQQGQHKMWHRSTRYDFYWPAFAHLGEQAVLRKEIFFAGVGSDNDVFGYQERWAEYRYKPSQITGMFRSAASGTLDAWHLAQNFSSAPVLGDTFISDTPPVSRVVAAGAAADGQQILFDSVFAAKKVRPLPMYSVPGFIDRF